MLPRAAAVSILAVGSLAAVLGGGYLLQQQGATVEPPEVTDETTEPPSTIPPDAPGNLPEAPPSPAKPGSAERAPAPPGGAPAGGGTARKAPPPEPRAKEPSIVDRLIELPGKQSAAAPGAPAGTAPPPAGAPGVPGAPPPAGEPAPAMPAENFGPTANPRENFREVIVPAGLVVEVVLTKDLSSAEAKAEAPVEARITRSYRVGDDLAVPENTRLVGLVTAVEQQGAVKGRGRIDFRFYRLRLPDGSAVAIETPVQRYEGPAPAGTAARKAGGAALGGAVVGILLGGTSGAVKGAAAGAAAATAGAVAKGEPEPVVIPANVPFDIRIVSSVRVHIPIKGPR